MGDALIISVRRLVEFSIFYPDIIPAREMTDMLAGMRAHQNRQQKQLEGYEIEAPVKHTMLCLGQAVTVQGRMDAFLDGDVPLVEEIKRSDAYLRLDEPQMAHRKQAVCYGALLALERNIELARIRIAYVDEQGEPLRLFEEECTREVMIGELNELLEPYVRYLLIEVAHKKRRDESLHALPFPFENYRAGQREMAVQVYTAISLKKRLYASLPTGTGKSAAVLYPALKAMGEGKTGKLLYLTARTTTRQSPLLALQRMQEQGLRARVTTLSAKEKLCPVPARCHPDDCPRARGHFVRQGAGIDEIRGIDEIWTEDVILRVAQHHMLCPFEFSLALVMLADVALMDYNYAFDPLIRIQRLFQSRRDITLLVDEAHHLLERARSSLSGEMDSCSLGDLRRLYAAEFGRKTRLYASMTALMKALRALPLPPEQKEARLSEMPSGIDAMVDETTQGICEAVAGPMSIELRGEMTLMLRRCFPFLYAAKAFDESYACLVDAKGKEKHLELYCLLPAAQIERFTHGLRGCVFFSATLSPLSAMKELLGGGEDDACFSLPSPFPKERLAVVRQRIDTRYHLREQTAKVIAHAIRQAFEQRRGKYIAFFPSYKYLSLVKELLDDLPLHVQENDMEDAQRERFLAAFTQDGEPLLGMCVLGGSFAEGIDLPGDRLIGVMIVSVGLPTPSLKQTVTRQYYDQRFGDGFAYACRYPAMQKVCQAAGRLIRGETDTGLVLLLDGRYYEQAYYSLLPPDWEIINENIDQATRKLRELEDEKMDGMSARA